MTDLVVDSHGFGRRLGLGFWVRRFSRVGADRRAIVMVECDVVDLWNCVRSSQTKEEEGEGERGSRLERAHSTRLHTDSHSTLRVEAAKVEDAVEQAEIQILQFFAIIIFNSNCFPRSEPSSSVDCFD